MEKLNFQALGPWEGSCDSLTMAKMRADSYNRTQGSLTGYNCPKCLNRGGFLEARQDGSLRFRDCSCMKTRRSLQKLEASGLKTVIREKTFEAFAADQDWQKALKAGARDYAEDPRGWFLLCGQSGCGKTHLCTAICRERLLRGDQVRYMPWRDEIPGLKAAALDPEGRAEKLEELKKAELLYIDDLFKTGRSGEGSMQPSAADLNLAFEILNYRYINRLKTVISSEFSAQGLVGLDEALGGRILELAGPHCYTVSPNPRRNYRLRQAASL